MITRVIQRKRPRGPALLVIGGAVVAAGLIAAVALATLLGDTGTLNVEVATRAGFATDTTAKGAIVQYIGDSNTSFGSSGTGIFTPFVRLQGSPSERGYDTNGATQFETKVGTWTHAIKVSFIPIVPCGAFSCWELFNDINETNSAKHISLNTVEVYYTTDPLLTGYPFTDGTGVQQAKVQYAFSGSIHINDVNQGSGRGDLRYLIPLDGPNGTISIPTGCNQGNTTCGTYFVLYSQWGAAAGTTYASDGGFEEWKVKAVTPSANPTIATTLSASPVAIGVAVHDSATLSGQTATAGGTVTYSAYAGANTCTGTDLLNSTVTVAAGVVPNSANFTPLNAGTYSFQATYSGDAHNTGPVSSTCSTEQLVVNPNTVTIATTMSANPVAIGVAVHDSSALTGATAGAGGSVTYSAYAGADTCTGTDLLNSTVTVVGGSVPDSANFTPLNAGTYSFQATYSGDANNNNSVPVSSTCSTEQLVVNPNDLSAISTPIVQIKDTFTVSGFAVPASVVPVVVGLYSDSGCTLANLIGSDNFAAPVGGGSVTGATSFVGALAGSYYFKISYAGDANNNSFSSCHEAVGVTITALP